MISSRGKLIGLKRNPAGEEVYDSDLEKYYMVELERMPGVKMWTKKHGIKIPYKALFVTRHYLPDFLVEFNDGSKEMHETKGLPLLFWTSTAMKREVAEAYCKERGWKYKLITKDKEVFYRNNFIPSIMGSIKDIKI